MKATTYYRFKKYIDKINAVEKTAAAKELDIIINKFLDEQGEPIVSKDEAFLIQNPDGVKKRSPKHTLSDAQNKDLEKLNTLAGSNIFTF